MDATLNAEYGTISLVPKLPFGKEGHPQLSTLNTQLSTLNFPTNR
jgi:hypothetical protein